MLIIGLIELQSMLVFAVHWNKQLLSSAQGLTAYHDIALDKCYVIELNTTIVMPPRNLWELLINVKVRRRRAASTEVMPLAVTRRLPLSRLLQKGTYLPQTYIIHEEMVVTGKVHNVHQLGPFIYRLCSGKDTYRLNRRVTHRRKSGSERHSLVRILAR